MLLTPTIQQGQQNMKNFYIISSRKSQMYKVITLGIIDPHLKHFLRVFFLSPTYTFIN